MTDDFRFSNMADVRNANRELGHHFFDRDTMRFFDSKIVGALIGGRYFITSERFNAESPRLYTIRKAQPNGDVGTVGAFQQYRTREAAYAEAKAMAKGQNLDVTA